MTDSLRPILVALGPEAQALRLVHRAFWLAREEHAPWIAVHIAVSGGEDEAESDSVRLWLLEAERLGAETLWIEARTVAGGLLEVIRQRQPGRVLVGRTQGRWPWARLGHSLAQELGRRPLGMPLDVIALEPDLRHPLRIPPRNEWVGAAAAAIMILGASTGVGWILPPEQPLPAVFLLFLLGTAFIAQRWGLVFGAAAVGASTLLFDLVFDSRPGSIQVGDWPLLGLFVAILALGQYAVALSERIRDQARALRLREVRMASLLLLGSRLAQATTRTEVAQVLSTVLPRMLQGRTTLSEGEITEAMLQAPSRPSGALFETADPTPGEPQDLLRAVGIQVALTLERLEAQETVQQARLAQETEQMRSGLLEAIGHDLRTPLAAIQGAASSLLLNPESSVGVQSEWLTMICRESDRLGTLLHNLLELTRLERLQEAPSWDWIALDEVLASAIRRVEATQGEGDWRCQGAEGLPLVRGDGVLLEQLFINLLVNARRHAPGSPVLVALEAGPAALLATVTDRGPGIPEAHRQRVFDKFVRLPGREGDGGVGLGLAICEAVVRLHGGRIWVEEGPERGARFCVSLPRSLPPELPDGWDKEPA